MTASAHTFTVDGIVYTPPPRTLPYMRRPMIKLVKDLPGDGAWRWSPTWGLCEACWMRPGPVWVGPCDHREGGE